MPCLVQRSPKRTHGVPRVDWFADATIPRIRQIILKSAQLFRYIHKMCTLTYCIPLARFPAPAQGNPMRTGMQRNEIINTGIEMTKRPEPNHSEQCSLCDGTGWKPVETESGTRVARCDCRLQSRAQGLLAGARIPKRYEHCELSNFEFDGPHRDLAAARMAACRFVEEYPLDKTGLLLTGSIGVGKTHLAVGIVRGTDFGQIIACLFYDYRELLKQIQNSYNDSVKMTELDVLRPVFDAEVLVLDELGAVKPTEWVWDTVSLILNTRYNDNRTTIITTNFDDKPAGATSGPRGAMHSETTLAIASESACAPVCMKCAAS